MERNSSSIRIWVIYLAAVLASIVVHELGHAVVAWAHGIKAVPTLAKQYTIGILPEGLNGYIALGGIIGTLTVVITGTVVYTSKPGRINSAIFAASIASPAAYSLLFFLKGRGHDASEFQDAQAALGFSYSGHFLDWLFVSITSLALVFWVLTTKPAIRSFGRLMLGAIFTFLFIATVQKVNNSIFDPIFEPKTAPK